MKTVKELQNHGIDKMGVQIIQNSYNFKSSKERFDDGGLLIKATQPGPGYYEPRESLGMNRNTGTTKSGTQLGFKNSSSQWGRESRPKIVNPPSIPSHMNIFGYDENEMGQLIKQ